jgi:hypothetical protein
MIGEWPKSMLIRILNEYKGEILILLLENIYTFDELL